MLNIISITFLLVINTNIYHTFKLSYATFSPDQANECLNNFQQVVAVLKKEVTKTHNESEHEDIGGYRQVLFVRCSFQSL